MTISAGQQSSLHDLESIAQWADALEIMAVTEPKVEGGFLLVEVALRRSLRQSRTPPHKGNEGPLGVEWKQSTVC